MSVRDLEKYVSDEKVEKKNTIVRKNNNTEYKDVERMMKETLGSNVKI